jgi:DNA-binding transcriptional LysR family regulator
MPNICLDLALLKTFVTVSEAQGFTRAGERLGLSQPAVSLQMKRLEESVGRQLVEREARGLMLTPDGEILLGYAREMMRLMRRARACPIATSRVSFGSARQKTSPPRIFQTCLPGLPARIRAWLSTSNAS